MSDTVLILGAGGRFGRAAGAAFAGAGWHVRTLSLTEPGGRSTPLGAKHFEHRVGDPLDPTTLDTAVRGVDVIVHAINPPYGRWAEEAVPLARATARAAARHGATILLPGNVYAYGAALPPRLDERTPFAPSESLGRVRAEIERVLREASEHGARTIVLRSGDFIEGRRSGNWFEDHVLAKLDAGLITYPGPLDRTHAWAWLPDLAAAAVALATVRTRLAPFESVGFAGWSLTGGELVEALERIVGRPLRVRAMPWWALRLAAPFIADLRGVLSVRWLWQRAHAIDGTRFAELCPDFRALDSDAGLALALERLERGTATTTLAPAPENAR